MKILGIESSCDETAAAVIEDGRKICSSVIHTQVEEHKLYGGVVPEIASRRHIESICGVTAEALEQAGLTAREVDAVAVTAAPGLIGAVLVGVNFAKGLALSAEKPLIPVHHIRGHVAANYLAHPELEPPFLALIVSGGHSHIVLVRDYCDYTILGRTTDDAAGEAFDKAAAVSACPIPAVWRWMPSRTRAIPTPTRCLPPMPKGSSTSPFRGSKQRSSIWRTMPSKRASPWFPPILPPAFAAMSARSCGKRPPWPPNAAAAIKSCWLAVFPPIAGCGSVPGRVVPKKAGSFTCRRFLSPGIMPL